MSKRILIVDDQESILFFLRKTLEEEGYEVVTAPTGTAGLRSLEQTLPDLVLLDLKLPDGSGLDALARVKDRYPQLPVVMMTAFGEVDTAVEAMKRGAFDYVNKPIKLEQLLVVMQRALSAGGGAGAMYKQQRDSGVILEGSDIVPSIDPKMQEIYGLVQRLSISGSTTVMIEGESGTGKEVAANLVHQNSPRKNHAFLEINCASLPEELLESELFGHEKGAFTDAINQKMGLLELAHRGTLFLDEIGEMSLTIQVKLLRVLEKMAFRRVGGVKDIKVDVRIVSATNRNLRQAVREGTFREDLYYRLKVIPLRIPALRERPGDILPLANHFLRDFSQKFSKRFERVGSDAANVLMSYSWPGNIRELKNMMERVALLEDGTELAACQVPVSAGRARDDASVMAQIVEALQQGIPADGLEYEELVEGLEKALIEKAYQEAEGNQSLAAKLLNLNRDKLRYRMKAFELI